MGGGNTGLLRLARAAIESRFIRKELDIEPYARFADKRGVFVTLKKDDELRGCIGYLTADEPLSTVVPRAAKAAAFDDPRFPALEPEELGSIRLEITLLTKPRTIPITKPEDYLELIEVGRDGLIIKQGFHQGLLLPQVPTEYGWNVETYLEQLCRKAGLPIDAWKDPRTEIRAFQGEIVTED